MRSSLSKIPASASRARTCLIFFSGSIGRHRRAIYVREGVGIGLATVALIAQLQTRKLMFKVRKAGYPRAGAFHGGMTHGSTFSSEIEYHS